MLDHPFSAISCFYHFTDRRNIPSIKAHGGLLSFAELERQNIAITAPGGNSWSRDADRIKGLENFVHLCFRSTHPMEFKARQDGRILETIFLEIIPTIIQLDGVLFTPEVSNKSGVTPFPILKAAEIIDFEILTTRTDWKDPSIQARLKNVEKYEILVPNCVPLNHIRGI